MGNILNIINAISEKVMVKEVVGPILVICISILINGVIKNVVHRFFHITKKRLTTKEEKRTITVVSLITNIIKYIIILIDVIIILGIYGIPTTSIIASLGAVGVTPSILPTPSTIRGYKVTAIQYGFNTGVLASS